MPTVTKLPARRTAAAGAAGGAAGMKRSPAARGLLNRATCAASLGLSLPAFDAIGAQPNERRGRELLFTMRAITDRLIERERARWERERPAPAEPESDTDLARLEREEKLRLTKAQADGQEIKNAQQRRELAPIKVIEWVLGRVGGEISALLDALPMQMKKRNPKLTAADIEVVKRDIARAMNAAARITVDLDEYLDTGR